MILHFKRNLLVIVLKLDCRGLRAETGARDTGGLSQAAVKEKSEKWSDSRYILKVKSAEFTDIGCSIRGKQRSQG